MLTSIIQQTYTYHPSLLRSIVCDTSTLTSMISRILGFFPFINLDVLTDLRQKSNSVGRSFLFWEKFKIHISEAHSKTLCTIALKISNLFLGRILLRHKTKFKITSALLPSPILFYTSLWNDPSWWMIYSRCLISLIVFVLISSNNISTFRLLVKCSVSLVFFFNPHSSPVPFNLQTSAMMTSAIFCYDDLILRE